MNKTRQVTNTGFFNAVVFVMQHNLLRAEMFPSASSQVESQLGAAPLSVGRFTARPLTGRSVTRLPRV